MLKKKLFAAGAAVAVAAAIAAPTAAFADYLGFTDVSADHWAAEFQVIDYAVGRGVFKGYDDTHFGPDDPVTRGQVAVVMYRICAPEDYQDSQIITNTANSPFGNTNGKVSANTYYYEGVTWSYHEGLLKGNGSYVYPKKNMYGEVVGGDYVDSESWETFKNKNSRSEPNVRPDDSVTREELAVMLQRMAEHRGTYKSSQADYAKLDSFPDADSVSSWARDAMAWAVGEGIMGGGGFLNPQGTATRAEASKMFQLTIEGKGFTIEGKDKVWVESTAYTNLPYWTCTTCGAQSTYNKNAIVHKASCPYNSGGTVWISEQRTESQMYDLADLTGGQKEYLTAWMQDHGLLTGWYEWV